MDTRPTLTGWQHWLDVQLWHAPPSRFTNPLAALDDMESGLEQPMVGVIEEQATGAAIARVSVFSDGEEPSPIEVAALEGLAAELTYADQ